MVGLKLSYAVNNAKGEPVVPQGKKITNSVFREMTKQGITEVEIAPNDRAGRICGSRRRRHVDG